MVIASAALLLGAALHFKMRFGAAAASSSTPEAAVPGVESSNALAPTVPRLAPTLAPSASPVAEQQHQEAIDAEIDRLQQLAAREDAQSLAGILTDLNHPEKQVRQAAIDAAKEFGSANAIPALKAAADSAEDLREKIALLEAADFLSLPKASFDEQASPRTPEQIRTDQERRAQREARRQARMPRAGSRESPPPPAPAPSSAASSDQ